MVQKLGIFIVFLLLAGCQATSPEPGTGGPGPISDPELRPLSMVFQENQNDPHISTFSKAVLRADLTSLLSKPLVAGENGYKEFYTAFVPSNTAFKTYLQAQGVSEQEFLNMPNLATFVKAHLVEDNASGKVSASDSPEAITFETLAGNQLTLRMEGERCFVENASVQDCTFIVNETAQQNDELTFQQKYRPTNGELLVIDEVLAP